MSEHVTPDELWDALGSGLPPKRAQEAVRHLLRGCPECQTTIGAELFPPRASHADRLPPALDAAYETALERVGDLACHIDRLPSDEREAFRKTHSLLRAGKSFLSLAGQGVRVDSLGVCEALLARSWAVRFDNPQQMCHLASVAANVAEELDPEVYGEREVADLQARAWGELANASRVSDQLLEAEKAFGKAFDFLAKGTGDPRLKARLLDLQASLWGVQRHFRLALGALDVVANLYRELGEEHLAGRTLIKKAAYTFYDGDAEEALRLNAKGLAAIDREREPGLVTLAVKNDLAYLVELGRFAEANRLLFDNRARFVEIGRVVALRVRWIEGRINYGRKRWASAEAAFREVAHGFEQADTDMSFHRALAGLELAATLMQQGRISEAEVEVIASHAVFSALQIHREAMGAVIILVEAFRTREISADLIEGTARYIRRLQFEMGL